MFVHSRSSLENHTRFQMKMSSLYPFSDQSRAKTLPFGAAHTYMAYIYITTNTITLNIDISAK